MLNSLPISRLINIGVSLSPSAAQAQNISSLLILGGSSVIDTTTRMRAYASLAAVGIEFGTSAPEYLAAQVWFAQSPQPSQLYIGRWANAPTHGQLVGGPLSTANSLLAAWQAINTGSFSITIDGGAPQDLAALNFAAAANLNGVATLINAALVGATVAYDSVNNRFVFTSTSTGAPSVVSFLTPTGSGVDISSMLAGTVALGAVQASGMAAETAAAAVALFDQQFGQQWFAVTVLGATDADLTAISQYIEASSTFHFHGFTTQEPGVLVASSVTDIAYLMSQAKFNRTAYQYSSTNPYAILSALARILTVDYTGDQTVITLMYKQEPGVIGENLNLSQVQALEAKNCNVFLDYNNGTTILEPGVCASGLFIDTIVGSAAFAVTLQTQIFNTLYQSPTKLPQTDAGNHILTTVVEGVCSQFESDGFLGAGTWDFQGFGKLKQGDYMPKGYYVYAPPIATQTLASRAARQSVPIQVAAHLAGAVHKVNLSISVS